MTYVDRSSRARGVESVAPGAVPSGGAAGEAAVALASERAAGHGGASGTARARRSADDSAVVSSVLTKLELLSDPSAVLALAQTMLRDLQCNQRAEDAQSAGQRAEIDLEDRIEADISAREADRQRAQEQDIAMVFQVIGSALALAAGAVGAAFTGGATLVGAIGLAIAVLGPLACTIATRCGGDATAAAVVSGACAVVGSIMSFGAGAAGGAAGAASTAATAAQAATSAAAAVTQATTAVVNTTVQGLQAASAVAQATQGALEVAASVHGGDAGHRRADSAEASARRERDSEIMSDATAAFGDIMRLFGRIAERMRATEDARAECLRIAAGARG